MAAKARFRFSSSLITRLLISNMLVILAVYGIGIFISFKIAENSLQEEGQQRIRALEEIQERQIKTAEQTLVKKLEPQMELLVALSKAPLVARLTQFDTDDQLQDPVVVENFRFCYQMQGDTAIAHCLRWRANELVSRTIRESHKGFIRSAIRNFLTDEDLRGILLLDWDLLYYEGLRKKRGGDVIPLHSTDELSAAMPKLEQEILYDGELIGKVVFYYSLDRIDRLRKTQQAFIDSETRRIHQALRQQGRQILANRIVEGLFFLVILIGAVSLVAITTIIAPIRALTRDADALARGLLDREIKTARKDEIGILAVSFEAMRLSIREKMSLLNQSWRAAKSANEAKSRFLANMSHEIRTPLNSIVANTDLALYETLSPRLEGYLDAIRTSAYTLLGLISDIIDFTRLDAGNLELRQSEFNPEDLLIRVADVFGPKAEEKQIELLIDWRVRAGMPVRGDEGRLEKILSNLLGNALKFTDNNGLVVLGIREFSMNPSSGSVDITWYVKDSGIGISREDRRKLFQAFSQVDESTSRNYEGIGIGLTLSKALVTLMSGKIWVESESGKGSTFYFSTRFETMAAQADDKAAPIGNFAGKSVLLIDDVDESRLILAHMLEALGFEVHQADAVREAVEMLKTAGTGAFDLILVDWHVPQQRDADTFAQIEGFSGTGTALLVMLPIGKNSSASFQKVLEQYACISKPVNPKKLSEALVAAFTPSQGSDLNSDQRPGRVLSALKPELEALAQALQSSDPVAVEAEFNKIRRRLDPATAENLDRHIQYYVYAEAAQIVLDLLDGEKR